MFMNRFFHALLGLPVTVQFKHVCKRTAHKLFGIEILCEFMQPFSSRFVVAMSGSSGVVSPPKLQLVAWGVEHEYYTRDGRGLAQRCSKVHLLILLTYRIESNFIAFQIASFVSLEAQELLLGKTACLEW